MADVTTMTDTAIPASATSTGGPSTGTGGIDWASSLGGLANVGFGLNTLFGNNSLSPQGNLQAAAAAADPFASQRGQYQTMLQGLMMDPSKFALSPAAQAQMTQGSENLSRQAAAQGFLGSGNILGELQKYGQSVASQDYYNQLNQLNQLAGVNAGSPATAGAILGDLYGARQLGQTQLGTGLNSLLSGGSNSILSQLLGGGSNLLSSLFGGTGTGGTGATGTSGTGGLLSSILSGLGGLLGGGTSGSSGLDLGSLVSGGSGSSALDTIGSSLGTSGTGATDQTVLDALFGGGGSTSTSDSGLLSNYDWSGNLIPSTTDTSSSSSGLDFSSFF